MSVRQTTIEASKSDRPNGHSRALNIVAVDSPTQIRPAIGPRYLSGLREQKKEGPAQWGPKSVKDRVSK
jgi:hypothetical protein